MGHLKQYFAKLLNEGNEHDQEDVRKTEGG